MTCDVVREPGPELEDELRIAQVGVGPRLGDAAPGVTAEELADDWRPFRGSCATCVPASSGPAMVASLSATFGCSAWNPSSMASIVGLGDVALADHLGLVECSRVGFALSNHTLTPYLCERWRTMPSSRGPAPGRPRRPRRTAPHGRTCHRVMDCRAWPTSPRSTWGGLLAPEGSPAVAEFIDALERSTPSPTRPGLRMAPPVRPGRGPHVARRPGRRAVHREPLGVGV